MVFSSESQGLTSGVVVYTGPANIAVGTPVYLNGADTIAIADGTVAGKTPVVGLVSQIISPTTYVVQYAGEFTGLTGLTAGATYFAGASGALTTSTTNLVTVNVVGVAKDTTTLILRNEVSGSIGLTGLFYESAGEGLTALSGGQAGALALTKELNRFTTVGAGNGASLPPASAGLTIIVINHGANSLNVYGAGTDTIDDVATATGVTQMVNSVSIYTCTTSGPAGKWYAADLGAGWAAGLMTLAYADSISAAGTTQSGATGLTATLNRVTTASATSAPWSGIALQTSAPGLQIEIVNSGANPIQVYGNNTEAATINGIATGTGVTQGVNVIATYTCTTAGNWTVQFGQPQQAGVIALSADGAISPHTPHTYAITKAGSLASLTLAAPTSGTDDGLVITVTGVTNFAHKITATNLYISGVAGISIATWPASAGGTLVIMAYLGKWQVISAQGITFS